jgi:RNA recognition motif-containing protein
VEGRRVYIGNLAFNAKEEDVWSWAFGCDPQAVHIPRNPRTDRSTGYAFIEFANSADAQRAVQALNGTKILNRKLSVQLAKPPNGQVQPDATSAGPIQPVHVQKSIVQASQQSESSGSESDDDESDDDAMSVSEEGSVEEREVARDGEVTKDQPSQSHPQPQPIAEEDSEDGEESDEMEESESDEDEEVTGDVGVSLKDVEALPMDEDGASSDDESSGSDISAQDVPSDDEEGEIEEPLVPTMPGNESEEEPEEEESEDSGSEDGQVVSKNAAQAITSVQTNAVAEQSEAMAGLEVRTGEPAMHDMLVDSTASFDQAPQSTFVETKTIDEMELADDNDDEFYEPENEVGEAKMAQPGEASITQAEEDDYDPEFDAAFEEAFAEIDDTSAEAGGDAANPLQVSATTANGTLAENVQHAPEEAQPDRSSGIPGLSFFPV